MAVVFYTARNKQGESVERHVTLPITDTGSLSGQLPKELRHLTKDQIFSEILDNLEAEGLDDWLVIQEGVIIPPESEQLWIEIDLDFSAGNQSFCVKFVRVKIPEFATVATDNMARGK